MSGETVGCLVIGGRTAQRPENCAGPASATSSPGAVAPEATSWAGSGTLSPLYPRRYYVDAVPMPARWGRSISRNSPARSPRTAASIRREPPAGG